MFRHFKLDTKAIETCTVFFRVGSLSSMLLHKKKALRFLVLSSVSSDDNVKAAGSQNIYGNF